MKIFIKSITFLVFIAIFSGCSKDMTNAPSQVKNTKTKQLSTGALTISSISPSSGITYTAITITGSNFDTAKTNNVVKINGVTALVNSATSSQLVVTVLPGTSTGKITVTTGGSTTSSSNDFKVLHLVKTAVINQPADTIMQLAFDNTNKAYVLQHLPSGYWTVARYTNGNLTRLYKTPNDTTTNGINGYHNAYTYALNGLATDNQGNIYTSLGLLNESYSVNAHWDPRDNSYSYSSSILKITPQGQVSVLASNINAVPFGNVTALTVDPDNNIYILDKGRKSDANDIAENNPYIDKITPAGDASNFYTPGGNNNTTTINNIYTLTTDKSGNVYVGDRESDFQGIVIRKITTNGTSSIIFGPNVKWDALTSTNFDSFGNLVVTNSWFVFLINSAGYSTYNYFEPYKNITQYNLAFDNNGNVYNATFPDILYKTPYAITKFTLQ